MYYHFFDRFLIEYRKKRVEVDMDEAHQEREQLTRKIDENILRVIVVSYQLVAIWDNGTERSRNTSRGTRYSYQNIY